MKNLAICFALSALAFGCKTSQDTASLGDAEGANIPVAECCASKSDCSTESDCSAEEKASCSASEKASCSSAKASSCSGATEVN